LPDGFLTESPSSTSFPDYLSGAVQASTPDPRSNRKTKRRYSYVLYRTRNLVERLFIHRIMHFRRVFTRYGKPAESYLVFASLAGPAYPECPPVPLVPDGHTYARTARRGTVMHQLNDAEYHRLSV